MPNWCNNNLTLTFPTKEEADELHLHMKKEADDDNWSFFGFFVPEVWDQDSWYWSRVDAWGTKWDAYTLEIDDTDMPHGFEVQFETAWSPPEEVCNAIREQFDDLSISWFYDEPGCELAGYL